MLAPFEASWLKIARARCHLEELEAAISAYLANDPVSIIVEEWKAKTDFPTDAWTARIRKSVPPYLSVIIGDAIHNLRTALDLTANDLVRVRALNTKGVYFPFADSESGLDEMIKLKNFNRAGPEAVSVLKFLKPFRGGNAGLRALHDLDVADKHQALVPILGTAVFDLSRHLPGADDGTKAQLKQWSTKIDHDGQEVMIIPSGWGPRRGVLIEANYVLWTWLSPSDVKAGGHEILPFLKELARIVENIVGEFSRISKI
jgi:hypothetical protein